METARMLVILVLAMGMVSVSPAEENTWTTKADMPTRRYVLSSSVVDGKIYAIGGGVGTGASQTFSTVEAYDPVTDTWTVKADMPMARATGGCSAVNGRIYVIGGKESAFGETYSSVQEYDATTDTWTAKADMPTARAWLSSSVVNGKVYAIGGTFTYNGTPLSTVEEYNPATDTWTRKADMPTARACLTTSAVNGKIYAFGGTRTNPMNRGISTVEEYDPATDTWTRKANMPRARVWLSSSVVNEKIYVIGGLTYGNTNHLPLVEEYDPATDTWTRKADMPTARSALTTSAVNGKIYAIGGWMGSSTIIISTVEEYDTGLTIASPDFNGDGIVDSADMGIMVDYWHTDYALCDIAPTPFGDGIVDAQDMLVLTEYLTEEKVDVEADIAAIEELLDLYAVAMNTGDLELWLSLHTDDIVKMPPDAPASFGQEQLRANLEPLFDNFTFEMATFPEETQVDGDLGYSWCNYTFLMTPKAGGEPIFTDGKALSILKRQPDGSWKLSHDCFNSNLPPAQ
ncbi:MAG: kelch repeat-containing protein [Planctomycetota bacterium]|jgi:uncharacterized protein (TIGR02246 family)